MTVKSTLENTALNVYRSPSFIMVELNLRGRNLNTGNLKAKNLLIRVLFDRQDHAVQTFPLFFNTNVVPCSTAKTTQLKKTKSHCSLN